MNTWEMRVNVYNNSLTGHANVSFYEDGEHQFTIGANILLETPKLAFPQTRPFQPDDGIYRDESAYHLAEVAAETVTWASVPLPEATYDQLLSEAYALENQTYNYSVFTEACIDFVGQFYEMTGHPGQVGDLFAEVDRHGSLIWGLVPVSLDPLLNLWPEDVPIYVPLIDVIPEELDIPDPMTFSYLPMTDAEIRSQKPWIGDETHRPTPKIPDFGEHKVVDVASAFKDGEPKDRPLTPDRADPKPDGGYIPSEMQSPGREVETKDDTFEYSVKEDHFEFEFEGYESKPDPSEKWDSPSPDEHKSPPTSPVVEVSKPEPTPEPAYVDPDYYGYF